MSLFMTLAASLIPYWGIWRLEINKLNQREDKFRRNSICNHKNIFCYHRKSFPTPGISITINFLSPQLHWYLISQTYSCTPILCRWRRLEVGRLISKSPLWHQLSTRPPTKVSGAKMQCWCFLLLDRPLIAKGESNACFWSETNWPFLGTIWLQQPNIELIELILPTHTFSLGSNNVHGAM